MKILRQVNFSKKEKKAGQEKDEKAADEYFDKARKTKAIAGGAVTGTQLGINYLVNRHFHKNNKAYTRKGDLKDAALWAAPTAAIAGANLVANELERRAVKKYLKETRKKEDGDSKKK